MTRQINFVRGIISRNYSLNGISTEVMYDVIIIPTIDARIKYPKHRRFERILRSNEYNIRSQYEIYVLRDGNYYTTLPEYSFVLLSAKEPTYEEKEEAEKIHERTRHMPTRLVSSSTMDGKKKVEKKPVLHTSRPYQFRDELGRRR